MSVDDIIKTLRPLAEKATPGPWHAGKYGITSRHGVDANNPPRYVVSWDYAWGEQANEPDDKPYIAAASPDVTRALMDEVERLRGDLALAYPRALQAAAGVAVHDSHYEFVDPYQGRALAHRICDAILSLTQDQIEAEGSEP